MLRMRALAPTLALSCCSLLHSTPLHYILALHIWPTYSTPESLRCPLTPPLPHWLACLLTAHSSSLMYSLLTPALMHHLPNSWTHPPHVLSYSPPPLPPFIHPCGPTPTPTFTKLPTQTPSPSLTRGCWPSALWELWETDESDLVTGLEGLLGQW